MDLDLNNLSLENDSQETFEKILNAFSKGDTKKIEKMLENVEKNLVINETDSDGRTLLHLTGAEFIFENIWYFPASSIENSAGAQVYFVDLGFTSVIAIMCGNVSRTLTKNSVILFFSWSEFV